MSFTCPQCWRTSYNPNDKHGKWVAPESGAVRGYLRLLAMVPRNSRGGSHVLSLEQIMQRVARGMTKDEAAKEQP